MRKWKHALSLIMIVFLFFSASMVLLSQTTLCTLEGLVTDEQGEGLPGVTINLRNLDTGYFYSTTSKADGRYIISGIQPGKYEVEVSLSGFKTQKQQGLVFNVGARLTLNFTLSPATIEEEVVVVAQTPMVEITKSDVSKVIDRTKIDELPLLDRNFGALAVMKPGVQGDRSNAQPAGSEEIIIDGVSNEWVGRNVQRTNIPADAIEEFRVITNQFQAEYGNTSGMIWTAITRSGTNEFRGRLSFFYRDETFDDVNYFVNHAYYQGPELPKNQYEKPPYEHYLFGGFLGGPIKRDKAHFFLAYEGLQHTEYATITSPLVPKETIEVTNDYNQILAKFNYQLNEKNLFSFRYVLNDQNQRNLGVGGLYTKERAYDYLVTLHEFQTSWTLYPTDNSMSEFRLLFSDDLIDLPAHSAGAYTIDRPSGYFGKYSNIPQRHKEQRIQVVENFSLFVGKHTIKIGLDYSRVSLIGFVDQFIPGQFIFTTDKPFDPSDFSTYPLIFIYNKGLKDFDYPYTEAAIFAQDSWKVSRRLTLNLGLRWNYYYCKDISINHSDLRHLNPRFAFSWDPIGDGRTVIRGGFGTFMQNPQLNIGLIAGLMAAMEIRTIFFPNYTDPFKPNPFFPSIAGVIPLDKYSTEPNLVPPFSLQMTLGGERQLLTDLSVGVDFVWTKGSHFTRLENFNPVIPGTGNQRKDPTKGNQWVFTDNGRSDYKGMYVTVTKRFSHGWGLDIAYTLSKSMSDVETEQTSPWSYDEDAWERQYGPSNTDARHRLAITGLVNLPFGFQLSGLFYYQSKLPWTAIYATDKNLDSLRGDYVDEHRNSRRGFDNWYLNIRLAKQIKFDRFRIQFFAEGYNVTNRVNFTTIYNIYGDANFGQPIEAGDPRQIQFGVRLDF
ncbi:MAG: TonB-dependent receptor [Candidatus Aminicenantes bacterium]|nr:TonB-dependent receptor [Candidatus Aminicenantes bacterium]